MGKTKPTVIIDKMKLRINGKWKEYDVGPHVVAPMQTVEIAWTFIFEADDFWLKILKEEAVKETIAK